MHADEELLVVFKPAGVVSEPGKGHARDSLLNGLFCEYAAALQNMGEARDWGLLHRLDKDTSGLLLVALRGRTYDALRSAFEERRVKKAYWAIVAGVPRPAQGIIQKPIREVTGLRKRAVIGREGQKAVTAYRLLAAGPEASLVEARPATGRLHQIRVHLAALGCPLLGDSMYGREVKIRVPRLCLHAARLSFVHPVTQRRMEVESAWPRDLRSTLGRLELPNPTEMGE